MGTYPLDLVIQSLNNQAQQKQKALICMTINNYGIAKAWVITKVNKRYKKNIR